MKIILALFALSLSIQGQDSLDNPLNSEVSGASSFVTCDECRNSFKMQEDLAFKNDGFHTRSVTIFQKDKIVFERYSPETSMDKPHRLWSMTKSVSSLLIGARITEGKIKLKHSGKLKNQRKKQRNQKLKERGDKYYCFLNITVSSGSHNLNN